MGMTAAVAIGAMVAGPPIMSALGLGAKEASPNLMVEQPPAVASKDQAAAGAADQQRKRAAAAGAQSSTNLTGGGLGEVGAQNAEVKTLLGY